MGGFIEDYTGKILLGAAVCVLLAFADNAWGRIWHAFFLISCGVMLVPILMWYACLFMSD